VQKLSIKMPPNFVAEGKNCVLVIVPLYIILCKLSVLEQFADIVKNVSNVKFLLRHSKKSFLALSIFEICQIKKKIFFLNFVKIFTLGKRSDLFVRTAVADLQAYSNANKWFVQK